MKQTEIIKRLVKALEANVRQCDYACPKTGRCTEIGIHIYADYDGEEYLCEKHKKRNFHRNYEGVFPPSLVAKKVLEEVKN